MTFVRRGWWWLAAIAFVVIGHAGLASGDVAPAMTENTLRPPEDAQGTIVTVFSYHPGLE